MPQAVLAQMNVRLPRQVKESGDAALAELGITPTEFVRTVWEKMAQGGEERSKVESAVMGLQRDERLEHEQRLDALRRARSLYERGMPELGIDPVKVAAVRAEGSGADAVGTSALGAGNSSDEDAYVAALMERMRERGTW